MSNSPQYKVGEERTGFGPPIYHVWDNATSQSIKSHITRKEARRLVVGLNKGYIQRSDVETAA